jgi:exopolysaccharide biosynthesis polyprenyl glycosylphosphotransferase
VFYLLVLAQGRFRRKVMILGAGWAGRTIFQAITEHAQTIYKVVGFIDDDAGKIGQQVEVKPPGRDGDISESATAPILGSSRDILQIIEQHNVSTLVLAITWDISGELYQVLTDCLQREVEVIPMPLLYEQLTGKVPVEHIGEHWSISMPLGQPGTQIAWHVLKRIFDLFWSSLGMVFLVLVYPFIALAIKLESKGPILYTQERMGRNGKVFRVYKFRSMIQDAETDHAVWAQRDDPRVTRIGKLLRKTHVDEFPQFWNILKGDMSVVGPRPERPEFISDLAKEIPFYRVRLAAKPGMAGWGLIHQGYGATKEDALEKLQYDLYYIKHQSLWLDLYILWRTVLDSLSLGGR